MIGNCAFSIGLGENKSIEFFFRDYNTYGTTYVFINICTTDLLHMKWIKLITVKIKSYWFPLTRPTLSFADSKLFVMSRSVFSLPLLSFYVRTSTINWNKNVLQTYQPNILWICWWKHGMFWHKHRMPVLFNNRNMFNSYCKNKFSIIDINA